MKKLLSYLSILLSVFILSVSCGSKSTEPESYSPYELVPPQKDTAEAKAFLANIKNKKFVSVDAWSYDIPESGNIEIYSSFELIFWGAKSATEGIYYSRVNLRDTYNTDVYPNIPDKEVYEYSGIIITNGADVYGTQASGIEDFNAWESKYFDTSSTPYTYKNYMAWYDLFYKGPSSINWNMNLFKDGTLENK